MQRMGAAWSFPNLCFACLSIDVHLLWVNRAVGDEAISAILSFLYYADQTYSIGDADSVKKLHGFCTRL